MGTDRVVLWSYSNPDVHTLKVDPVRGAIIKELLFMLNDELVRLSNPTLGLLPI